MRDEIVIIGFPKCGTSALIKVMEQDPDVDVLHTPDGGREVSWPLIRDLEGARDFDPTRIYAHKYSAYAYNKEAMRYLVGANSKSIITLCIRDLQRVLISWHHMHQTNANSGRLKDHFSWRERDFYATCTISDYYTRFAKAKLRHDRWLDLALKRVPPDRLVVMSQERIAQDIHGAVDYLKALTRDRSALPPASTPASTEAHAGYADKADVELDKNIQRDLRRVQDRLQRRLRNSKAHKYI
jgi:hypothetical protein